MAENDLDQNQPASPYKLQKARDKGQVAKSPDAVAAVVFIAGVVYLNWQGLSLGLEQYRFDQALFMQGIRLGSNAGVLWSTIDLALRRTLFLVMPFFVVLMISAILANLLQTGPVFSFHPLKPDWSRINPVTGFKRVLSVRTLFMAARALLKLSLLGTVAYFAVKGILPRLFHLADVPPLGLFRTLLDHFASLGMKLALVLAFIALLDLLYTRHEFSKNMRMSHHEIKEEHKHREGDPRIRARLRELRREILKRSLALRRTSEADVVITNPTHVAVALRYAHGQMASPQLVAKGKGFMAAAMRKLAFRHHIPVVQNPSLARAIYREMPLNGHVPPDLYAQVARIIVWVFARREAQRGQIQTTPSRPVAGLFERSAAWKP